VIYRGPVGGPDRTELLYFVGFIFAQPRVGAHLILHQESNRQLTTTLIQGLSPTQWGLDLRTRNSRYRVLDGHGCDCRAGAQDRQTRLGQAYAVALDRVGAGERGKEPEG